MSDMGLNKVTDTYINAQKANYEAQYSSQLSSLDKNLGMVQKTITDVNKQYETMRMDPSGADKALFKKLESNLKGLQKAERIIGKAKARLVSKHDKVSAKLEQQSKRVGTLAKPSKSFLGSIGRGFKLDLARERALSSMENLVKYNVELREKNLQIHELMNKSISILSEQRIEVSNDALRDSLVHIPNLTIQAKVQVITLISTKQAGSQDEAEAEAEKAVNESFKKLKEQSQAISALPKNARADELQKAAGKYSKLRTDLNDKMSRLQNLRQRKPATKPSTSPATAPPPRPIQPKRETISSQGPVRPAVRAGSRQSSEYNAPIPQRKPPAAPPPSSRQVKEGPASRGRPEASAPASPAPAASASPAPASPAPAADASPSLAASASSASPGPASPTSFSRIGKEEAAGVSPKPGVSPKQGSPIPPKVISEEVRGENRQEFYTAKAAAKGMDVGAFQKAWGTHVTDATDEPSGLRKLLGLGNVENQRNARAALRGMLSAVLDDIRDNGLTDDSRKKLSYIAGMKPSHSADDTLISAEDRVLKKVFEDLRKGVKEHSKSLRNQFQAVANQLVSTSPSPGVKVEDIALIAGTLGGLKDNDVDNLKSRFQLREKAVNSSPEDFNKLWSSLKVGEKSDRAQMREILSTLLLMKIINGDGFVDPDVFEKLKRIKEEAAFVDKITVQENPDVFRASEKYNDLRKQVLVKLSLMGLLMDKRSRTEPDKITPEEFAKYCEQSAVLTSLGSTPVTKLGDKNNDATASLMSNTKAQMALRFLAEPTMAQENISKFWGHLDNQTKTEIYEAIGKMEPQVRTENMQTLISKSLEGFDEMSISLGLVKSPSAGSLSRSAKTREDRPEFGKAKQEAQGASVQTFKDKWSEDADKAGSYEKRLGFASQEDLAKDARAGMRGMASAVLEDIAKNGMTADSREKLRAMLPSSGKSEASMTPAEKAIKKFVNDINVGRNDFYRGLRDQLSEVAESLVSKFPSGSDTFSSDLDLLSSLGAKVNVDALKERAILKNPNESNIKDFEAYVSKLDLSRKLGKSPEREKMRQLLHKILEQGENADPTKLKAIFSQKIFCEKMRDTASAEYGSLKLKMIESFPVEFIFSLDPEFQISGKDKGIIDLAEKLQSKQTDGDLHPFVLKLYQIVKNQKDKAEKFTNVVKDAQGKIVTDANGNEKREVDTGTAVYKAYSEANNLLMKAVPLLDQYKELDTRLEKIWFNIPGSIKTIAMLCDQLQMEEQQIISFSKYYKGDLVKGRELFEKNFWNQTISGSPTQASLKDSGLSVLQLLEPLNQEAVVFSSIKKRRDELNELTSLIMPLSSDLVGTDTQIAAKLKEKYKPLTRETLIVAKDLVNNIQNVGKASAFKEAITVMYTPIFAAAGVFDKPEKQGLFLLEPIELRRLILTLNADKERDKINSESFEGVKSAVEEFGLAHNNLREVLASTASSSDKLRALKEFQTKIGLIESSLNSIKFKQSVISNPDAQSTTIGELHVALFLGAFPGIKRDIAFFVDKNTPKKTPEK